MAPVAAAAAAAAAVATILARFAGAAAGECKGSGSRIRKRSRVDVDLRLLRAHACRALLPRWLRVPSFWPPRGVRTSGCWCWRWRGLWWCCGRHVPFAAAGTTCSARCRLPVGRSRHLVLLVLLVLVFGIVVTALPCRRWLPPFLLTQCDCFARRAIGRVDASRCLSPNCQLGGLARAFRRTESAVHLSPLGRHGGRWTALEGWTGPAQLGPVLGPVLGARNRSLAQKNAPREQDT